MSTNSQDYGAQTLSFDYREEARSAEFNKLFFNLLPYGIYNGLSLQRKSNVAIGVEAGSVVIPSNNDDGVAVKVDTSEEQLVSFASSVSGSCDTTRPYVILRFGWADVEENYMEIISVPYSSILETDIIVGKVNFEKSGDDWIISPTNPFDLSRRQEVFFKSIDRLRDIFSVKATEPASNKVSVSGGTVVTSKGKTTVAGVSIPKEGITPTESLGRIDIVALNEKGEILYIEGTPAANPKAPVYKNLKVLAEIRLGTNQSIVSGSDITQLAGWETLQGTIAPEDTPIEDTEELFPVDKRFITAAIMYLWKHSLVLNHGSPEVSDYQLDAVTDENYPLGQLFI